MSTTIIFATEATDIKEPVLIEVAWVELKDYKKWLLTQQDIDPFLKKALEG